MTQQFGQTLMPILQQLGLDPGQPVIRPAYTSLKPNARRRAGNELTPASGSSATAYGSRREVAFPQSACIIHVVAVCHSG